MTFSRFCYLILIASTAMATSAVSPIPIGGSLRFETASEGRLTAQDGPYGLMLEAGGMTVTVRDAKTRTSSSVTTRLVGANPQSQPKGEGRLAARANYLLGSDPSRWRTGAPLFERAHYPSVYPGVDLVFHGAARSLEYDFVVKPGADPRQIAMELSGASRLKLERDGTLTIRAATGEIRWGQPQVYQVRDGIREAVAGRFVLKGRRVTFALGNYDRRRELVIDPTLVYSTYLGGSDNDVSRGMAVDGAGNFYVTGYTFSSNLPRTGGSLQPSYRGGSMEADLGGDAFVAKYAPSGALIYLTYLGGSADDMGTAIAVDAGGNAYVTGSTASANFPTAGGFSPSYGGGGGNPQLTTFGDAFVAKLNPTGSALIYSFYLGGSQDDKGMAIAVDGSGAAYVGGTTLSANFPVKNAAYSTYKGTGGQPNLCSGCGPLIVNGDGFIAKVNAAGSDLVYSTYLGGSLDDSISSLAVDASGNVYAGGATLSTDFPAVNAAQNKFAGSSPLSAQPVILAGDGFVTKLDAAGKVVYSTYFGGSADDAVMGLAVDGGGAVYIAGFTSSSDLPGASRGVQKTFKGPATITGQRGFVWGDGFTAKLSATGSLAWSTYLGGAKDDAAMAIAVDASGNSYVGGFTNSSTDFPLSSDALQSTYGGTRPNETDDTGDAFVAKLSPDGTALLYSSFYGGANDEAISGLALDGRGNVYVTGGTTSQNLPSTTNAAQARFGGENSVIQTESIGDAFVAVFSGLAGAPVPVITRVVNTASGDTRLSAGSVATVFGSNLPADAGAGAKVGGQTATVQSASATQWVISIPATLPAGASTLQIGSSAAFNITLLAYAPALFSADNSGTGLVAAMHADGSAVTAAKPALPGETIQVTASGLGAASAPVSVSIGSSQATNVSAVAKSGAYQVTLTVPASLGAGNQTISLSIGGATSNSLTLPVGTVTGPVITDVENGASFRPASLPAGSWVTIKGVNLAPVTDTWEQAIVNGHLPTSLDGVSVKVGGAAGLRVLCQRQPDQRGRPGGGSGLHGRYGD